MHPSAADPFDPLISHSPGLEAIIRSAQIAAYADITVLILGETGTGKELLARAIHDASPRASNALITVNCAALNDGLLESQLFGHTRGSFTGAVADSTGYAEAAHKGTLFFDEIGELSPSGQASILRFLETGECHRVGAPEPTRVDVRVVAATHRDLEQMVEEGKFRQDLYYRLNIVTMELPPLRQRPGDIELLLAHFLAHYSERQGASLPVIENAALKRLQRHDWPGNVRELRNLCARMITLRTGLKNITEQVVTEELAIQSSSIDSSLYELPPEGIRLEEIEIDFLRQALLKADGNKSQAAKLLGISRDAFLYRLKKYGI